jgi:DNA replication and repair protein RecF
MSFEDKAQEVLDITIDENQKLHKTDFISNIYLYNFRKHRSLELNTSAKFILIIGDNATGKTSVLESISLLKDTFLSCDNKNIVSKNEIYAKISLEITTNNLKNTIAIEIKNNRRQYYCNNKKISNRAISNRIKVLSFNPKLQYDFLLKKGKRDFFDNFVSQIYSNHSESLALYLKFTKERINILQSNVTSFSWLDKIEKEMSSLAYEIANNRLKVLSHLHNISKIYQKNNKDILSQKIDFYLSGDIEDAIVKNDSSDQIASRFKDNRVIDTKTARTNYSVHRFVFNLAIKDRFFEVLSNSQQKLSILEAIKYFALVIHNTNKISPILLLDEITASFDKNTIETVILSMSEYFGQIFATTPINDFILPQDTLLIRLD